MKSTQVPDNMLGPAGLALKKEARGQVEYCRFMACLDRHLEHKTYQTIGYDLVLGIYTLFNNAAALCEKNPNFQSSLIVALFKSAVAKEKSGANAKTEERIVNFFQFIWTHNPKAASVLSANLGGPSKHWMKNF
eukprot:15325830-Ditylum_brightwellii.AAC.1